MRGARARTLGKVSILLFLSSMLVGCPTLEHAVSPDEVSGVRDGKVAAVLVRFVGTSQDGQPVKVFSGNVYDHRLVLSLGDFATGGEPTSVVVPSPWTPETYPDYPKELVKTLNSVRYSCRLFSNESRDQGWCAIFLPPGYYYLGLGDNGAGGQMPKLRQEFFPGDPEWRVEVPKGTAVLYAGTFYFSVTKNWPGAKRAIDQQATRIDDESPLAKDFAARDLASLPPPVTRLAVRHTGPRLLGVPTAAADLRDGNNQARIRIR